MTDQTSNDGRRRFLKTGATALVAIPLTLTFGGGVGDAAAAELPHLSESDPQAKALHYVDDASKSKVRPAANQFCHNCANYTGDRKAQWGPCTVFPGKDVNTQGWCAAWVKLSG